MSRMVKLWLILLCCSLAATSIAQTFVKQPKKLPTIVKIGLTIHDITAINESNETVSFEGMLTQQWQDSRLAFNAQQVGSTTKYYFGDDATQMLDRIWSPQIIFTNGRGTPDVSENYLTISNTGVVTYVDRFNATIETRFDFTRFPFEHQKINFLLQSFAFDSSMIKLEQLKSKEGMFHPGHLDEWQILSTTHKVTTMNHPLYQKSFSQYVMTLHFYRQSLFYFLQTIVPLVLIVLFSFSVFWMTHNPLVNRAMVSLTGMLTIVVFGWRIFSILPRINYLTFLDVLMLFSFLMVLFSLFPSVLYDNLSNERAKERMMRASKITYPIVYILGILVIILVYFG